MTFTIQKLAGQRAIISGTDLNKVTSSTVVSTEQYDQLELEKQHSAAHSDFDAAVTKFYAPLIKAADKLGAKHETVVDDVFSEVVQEAVEGVEPVAEVRINLWPDTVALRLIEGGNGDRLVWVGDNLEILA